MVQSNSDVDILLTAALQFLGLPYIWGGQGINGFDCSGLAREILSAAEVFPPEDTSAQGLHDWLISNGAKKDTYDRGSLVFYGKSNKQISHVVIALSPYIAIGANGGTSKTLTREDAIRDGAFVKIRAIRYRKDIVAAFMPNYPSHLVCR